ncbi:hypothetical protein B0J15DRAFT_506183 [Fusarium solani]|uniref:Secreted protein n=1 Tax=Fusarium solani TaxID=169388 RepID=A0A9P9JW01_FUSSL|nr:uncharacterized protein B0J15DRAFT_506183 [Fusarium solani]KAH7230819.1 hypothetical protein B0J15DRAFT_506183 [Fusarium solani]
MIWRLVRLWRTWLAAFYALLAVTMTSRSRCDGSSCCTGCLADKFPEPLLTLHVWRWPQDSHSTPVCRPVTDEHLVVFGRHLFSLLALLYAGWRRGILSWR